MAISPTDPYYRAETTPASVTALGLGLRRAYTRPADAFGAKGNLAHASGYHRSRAWVLRSPDSRRGSRDYSVTQPLDRTGPDSDVSAFDFTPGVWGSAENRRRMVELTRRVYDAARARDPRLANLREFAGTLDGKTVVTFRCSDGAILSPFDLSHLDHIHGSLWRSRANHDHAGLLAVLLGETMTALENTDPSYQDLIFRTKALVQGTDVTGGPAQGERNEIAANFRSLGVKIDSLTNLVVKLIESVNAGGGSLDTAAILAAVERAGQEARDAVADGLEGGAAQVRADADPV